MTGCEPLVGEVVDLSADRGGRTDLLRGVRLEAAGTAGVLLSAGRRRLFVPWPCVLWVATAPRGAGSCEEMPGPEDLAALWGDDGPA